MTFKGKIHPKMKILSLFSLLSFQTPKITLCLHWQLTTNLTLQKVH